MNTAMFENLSVEHAERKSAPRSVEVLPEIAKLIEQAWQYQNDPESPKDAGHIVRMTSKEEVDAFHKVARAAAAQYATTDDEGNPVASPLKYRRLSRVGADKDEKAAYFSLQVKPANETESEQETETETESPKPAAPRKPRARDAAK